MWQVLSLLVLLGIMIGMQQFNLELPTSPFDPNSLAATGFIILAAFTTGELFKRFNIPALLGYIVAGIVFGPNLFDIGVDVFESVDADLADQVLGVKPRALFGMDVIEDLALINILTIGVIGTLGGGELKISDIRDSYRSILLVILFIVLTAIPLSFGVVFGLSYAPGGLVAFLEGVGTNDKIAGALLLAVLAVAMSPAATLAIIQEGRARGKFTSLALGVVIVADLVLVAMFLFSFKLSELLVSPEGFDMQKLLAAIPGIGEEFGFALIIGAVTGVIFILYIRYVEREMLLFTVAIIFATTYVTNVFHAETLLAFLTAGFIVQNMSRYGYTLIHALEKISLPVFIIYFMTQAAQLDLKGVVAYLPLTLIMAAVRAGAFYGSARLALRLTNSSEQAQRLLWLAFISRGGIDLVLADKVAKATLANGEAMFAWGTDFQTVIMSTVVVHIIAGPSLLKYALGRAGETEEARRAAAQNQGVSGSNGAGDEVVLNGEFETPGFPNRYLNEHLFELRSGLLRLHSELIASPLERRRAQLEETLGHVNEEIEQGLDALQTLVKESETLTDTALAQEIRKLHTQSRRKLQRHIQSWERLAPLAFTVESAERLILEIQKLEDFENHIIVEFEPELYELEGAKKGVFRLLRRLRRIQRRIAGESRRTIPIGRLWRYYIELAIPRYLSKAAASNAPPHELFWYDLGRYIRRYDEAFLRASAELEPPEDELEEIEYEAMREHDDDAHHAHDDDHGDHGHGHGHDDAEEAHEPDDFDLHGHTEGRLHEDMTPRERALTYVSAACELQPAQANQLIERLTAAMVAAAQGYSWSLQQAYSRFLEAVAKAGTLELPGYTYRPSTQFDEARRASEHLQARLSQETDIVSAYIGWIVLDHQVTQFSGWFRSYQQRIRDTLRGLFTEQSLRQLQKFEERIERGADILSHEDADPATEEHEIAWTSWLRTELQPTSKNARRALDRALISFGQGVTSRRLIDTLEYRVASFSEQLNVLIQDPDTTAPNGSELDTLQLRVRQWFNNRLVNEIALHYIEFNERIERIVRRNLVGLDSVDQVLEYNLYAAQRGTDEGLDIEHANDMAVSALERAQKMVGQLAGTMQQDVADVERWIIEEMESLAARAIGPFLEHRLKDVQQQLVHHSARKDKIPESVLQRAVQGTKARAQQLYGALEPLYAEVIEDVRDILTDEGRPEQRALIRQQLSMGTDDVSTTLPPIYRRLFNPVPLDLPEFYVTREVLEDDILSAIKGWGFDRPTSILLFGDRGIGKRTLIHNLVPIRIYDLAPCFQETPIQTVRLSEDIDTEVDLCQQFLPLFPEDVPATFEELRRMLRALDQRQIIIVENATKASSRSSRGLDLARGFLQLINATSDKVLWLLLMDTPTVTMLDTTTDLFDYFTHAFELEPFDDEQVEQMILKRHRVSGFEMHFETPSQRLLYRASHPLAASEASRNPQRAYFHGLGQRSLGNPLLALLLWLSSVRTDDQDDALLHIEPLSQQATALSDALTLRKKLILALLLQHGSLTPSQLGSMLQDEPHAVEVEIDHLRQLGFVELMVGTHKSYTLRDIAAPWVTHELRAVNLV